mgnify:FL=1
MEIAVGVLKICSLHLCFRIKKMLVKSKDIPESIENNEAIMNIHNGKVGRQVNTRAL